MPDLEKIGAGATAEIFAWGEGKVLKLFLENAPVDEAQREATVTQAVIDSGFPAPKIYDVIEVDGRNGIIYERVDGALLFKRLQSEILNGSNLVREMAELHAQVHRCEASNVLPMMHTVLQRKIETAPYLSDDLKTYVLSHLGNLPQGNKLCHNDFHPLNIITTSERNVVIDWRDAKSGNPHADVARTLVILSENPTREEVGLIMSLVLPFFLPRMANIYLAHYCKVTQSNPADIKAWMPIMAAARLHEPSAKHQQLLKLIRDGFTN